MEKEQVTFFIYVYPPYILSLLSILSNVNRLLRQFTKLSIEFDFLGAINTNRIECAVLKLSS